MSVSVVNEVDAIDLVDAALKEDNVVGVVGGEVVVNIDSGPDGVLTELGQADNNVVRVVQVGLFVLENVVEVRLWDLSEVVSGSEDDTGHPVWFLRRKI